MSTYVIGDLQGCYDELESLLRLVDYHPAHDELWFTGDFINRGPQSLAALRFVKNNAANAVLGNHDLHFLAVAFGCKKIHPHKDTFQDILSAPDCAELVDWLRHQPLFYQQNNTVMIHAGLLPQWTVAQARDYANEVEQVLQSDRIEAFLSNMYGNTPANWDDRLTGWERLRVITNVLTRLRFCQADGTMDLQYKGKVGQQPEGFFPWFNLLANDIKAQNTILFGHWAALEGITHETNILALDTGCVWGGSLSAFRLEDRALFSVKSHQPPFKET